MPWQSPTITVKWGAYFQPDAADEKAIVDMCAVALTNGTATKRMVVEKQAAIFGTENIDATLEALEEEADDKAQRELDATKAAFDAEARAFGTGKGAPAKPAAASGSGGGA